MKHNVLLGKAGESHAAQIYQAQGGSVLGRNVRYPGGEIDLIVKERDGTVVFIEVKTRTRTDFGGAEAVTADKIRRLRRAIAAWLREHHVQQIRIDVVEIQSGTVRIFKGVEDGAC
ncbi:YraN family protein [Corynebacterium poyangense]|uniref:UPF0102 protein GP475_07340 n=1 Tax=Corynebacterium poyangense TaxID=2684405 RepID=A0A7H0SSD7_9CORY|nr:YraN family protein [Corynebacterium poyangense]QNQ91462.1 YraN family protein [Corynebacterium poyangense]